MKRIHLPASVVITCYGTLLLILTFFFLMHDNALHKLQPAMPWPFLIRFCTFWFISFVLALVFFISNLDAGNGTFTGTDKGSSRRAVLLTIGLAVLGTMLTVAVLWFFQL